MGPHFDRHTTWLHGCEDLRHSLFGGRHAGLPQHLPVLVQHAIPARLVPQVYSNGHVCCPGRLHSRFRTLATTAILLHGRSPFALQVRIGSLTYPAGGRLSHSIYAVSRGKLSPITEQLDYPRFFSWFTLNGHPFCETPSMNPRKPFLTEISIRLLVGPILQCFLQGNESIPAKSASFPKATHRCHSVRDSHVPASFFHDVLVASENTAMLVALLTFFSASLPRKPMRVILLRYIRYSCSARLSWAPRSEWARLPRPEAAFLGDRQRGSQNRNGVVGKAEASQAPGAATAPKQCRDRGVE